MSQNMDELTAADIAREERAIEREQATCQNHPDDDGEFDEPSAPCGKPAEVRFGADAYCDECWDEIEASLNAMGYGRQEPDYADVPF